MAQNSKYVHWIQSGLFGGLQKLSIPVSGVLITMILAHEALSKEEMGVWAIFLMITAIIEIIRQGLVKTALIRYMNYSEESQHRFVMGAALFLNISITLVLSLLLFFLSSKLETLLHAPGLAGMLYYFQIGLLFLIPFSHFEWILFGKTMFKSLFRVYLFRQGLMLLMVVAIFLFKGALTLNELSIIFVSGIFIGAVVAYRAVYTLVKGSLVFSFEWVKKLFQFGKYVFTTGLSSLVFRNAEQMMLSPLLSTIIFNAPQNIAMRFVNLSDLPSQTLGDILFPKSAQKDVMENPSLIKYYYEKTVGASLCFVLPLVLLVVLFPKLIIFVLAGPEYYEAIPYLQLVCFTCITLAYLKQFGVILDATGRPHLNLITISFLAAFHVGISWLMITQFQFLGAAYALLISHAVALVLSQIILHKLFRVNFLNALHYAFKFYPEFYKILTRKLSWKSR